MPVSRHAFVNLSLGFAVAAAPKVGTLSIVQFLFEVQVGRKPLAGEANHDWITGTPLYRPLQDAIAAGIPIVAVHRDPYERIRSAYQHRVVREREAEARSFAEFCEHLARFRNQGSIAWHTDPQTEWLGDSGDIYSATLGLEDLWRLPALLSHLTGRTFPDMGWKHQMKEKPAWEPGLKDWLAPWVQADFEAGWNGETSSDVMKIWNPETAAATIEASQQPPGSINVDRYHSLANWGWYRKLAKNWQQWLASRTPTRILEIGAFDGVSANLMLDHIFTHPESTVDAIDPYLPDPTTPQVSASTREVFEENRRRGAHGDRIRLHHGTSREVLARMVLNGQHESYDVIYVDGGHTAPDVLTDAVMAWPLLKPGGTIVFDDFNWGDGRIPQLRPREAILAFENAFARELIPLHQGYQRMFRKVGVPGGLKTLAGDPFEGLLVIVGCYNSGSSLLSLMMEAMGFDIGRPTREDFGESTSLRKILTHAFDEKSVRQTMDRNELIEKLRKWIGHLQPHAGSLCLKHPLIGMFLPEITEAFGDKVRFLRILRPLDEAIRRLTCREWFPDPEGLQRMLHHRTERFFREMRPSHSVGYHHLLADPARQLRKLVGALDLDVPEISIDRALRLVRPPEG